MTKPIILFHDVSKGDAIEREMTDEEYAKHLEEMELTKKEFELNQAKENARTSALAKLAALGLTEEEIAAL
jgi:hypothetical protein